MVMSVWAPWVETCAWQRYKRRYNFSLYYVLEKQKGPPRSFLWSPRGKETKHKEKPSRYEQGSHKYHILSLANILSMKNKRTDVK